ncbi:MAG: hypothetical protein ABR517_03280 [Thermoanaerobaculia bacterium]
MIEQALRPLPPDPRWLDFAGFVAPAEALREKIAPPGTSEEPPLRGPLATGADARNGVDGSHGD